MAAMATYMPMQWNTGQKVSALLHGGLIASIMVVDLFGVPDAPLVPEVTEVALISAQDFAQLSELPPVPPAPEPVPQPEPAPAPEPEPVTPPPPPEITAPDPVAITPPEPVAPQIAPPPPVVPEPVTPAPTVDAPQAAVIAPNSAPSSSIRPRQRPAERVAPTPIDTPDPDVAIAPRDQAAVTPDAQAQIDAQEAQEATQREAAATEVVTENTELSEDEPALRTATAPEVSLRPQRRPRRAQATQTPPATETAQAPTPNRADAIEDALAQALSEALGFDELGGGSLSQADADMLRLSIENCWNIGILSTDALNVVITIGFEMTEDARPVPGSIYQVYAEGGSAAAQAAAFDVGRRAIVECGSNGYGLPVELYEQWRLVEITFNPARMSN